MVDVFEARLVEGQVGAAQRDVAFQLVGRAGRRGHWLWEVEVCWPGARRRVDIVGERSGRGRGGGWDNGGARLGRRWGSCM